MSAHKQYADNLKQMTRQIKVIAKGRTFQSVIDQVKPPKQKTVSARVQQPQLSIEEIREVQRAACALAAAAQSECDFYTDIITQLEPP